MTKNRACGILLILFGFILAVIASGFNSSIDSSDPGPKLFPLIGCGGMIVCGAGIFFEKAEEKWKPLFAKAAWGKVALQFALLVGYVLGIHYIGFLISTPVLLFVFTTLYDQKHVVSVLKRIVYALLITGIIYLVFVKVLHVMLPMGSLF